MELGNQNSNPYSSIPQLCEGCRNRAGGGRGEEGWCPMPRWAWERRKRSLGWAPGGHVQNKECLWMQWGPLAMVLNQKPLPSYSYGGVPRACGTWGWEGERVGVCRHPGWTSRIQRVSTHHGGAQWGAECSEFDMNWARWHASTQSLQKTKAKTSMVRIRWFLWWKNSNHSQFQAISDLRICSKNAMNFNNCFHQAPENYYKHIMSHFLS